MTLTPEGAASFADLVTSELGEGVASTDPALILKCSSDWSRMSPILQEKLPPGRYNADLVVRPTTPEQVPPRSCACCPTRWPATRPAPSPIPGRTC